MDKPDADQIGDQYRIDHAHYAEYRGRYIRILKVPSNRFGKPSLHHRAK
jgi:hypothetical protein